MKTPISQLSPEPGNIPTLQMGLGSTGKTIPPPPVPGPTTAGDKLQLVTDEEIELLKALDKEFRTGYIVDAHSLHLIRSHVAAACQRAVDEYEQARKRTLSAITEKYVGNVISDLNGKIAKLEADNARLRTEVIHHDERANRSIEAWHIEAEQLRQQLANAVRARDDLAAWKESAMSVMPDYQKLGRLLKMPLGSSCSAQLVPGIEKLISERDEEAALADRLIELIVRVDKFKSSADVKEAMALAREHAKRRAQISTENKTA